MLRIRQVWKMLEYFVLALWPVLSNMETGHIPVPFHALLRRMNRKREGGGEVTFVLGVWFPGGDTLAITPEAQLSIRPTRILTPS